MSDASSLEKVTSAAYDLFGPPRVFRELVVCYGGGPRLRGWDERVAYLEIQGRCQFDAILRAFQIAHEVVHTLDPVPLGEASVLEEGAATYFQHTYVVDRMFTDREARESWTYSNEPDYGRAQRLVAVVLKHDRLALRRLRESGATLSDVSLDTLLELAPALALKEAEELLLSFEAWRKTI